MTKHVFDNTLYGEAPPKKWYLFQASGYMKG